MDVHNVLKLDPGVFDPASISEDTKAFNQKLMDIMSKGPKWYEVSHPVHKTGIRSSSPAPPSGTLAVCNASQEKLEDAYNLRAADLCPVCQAATGRHARFLTPTAAATPANFLFPLIVSIG